MIDIHSHILPEVDDGAQSQPEALDMLRLAQQQGVTTQVLTPHIHFGRFNNTLPALSKCFEQFKQQVREAGIEINLLLAAEVRIGTELLQLVASDSIPTLGSYNQKKVFLLEFPRTEIPAGSINLIQWLMSRNYLPLIVHPERNKSFLNAPQKLDQLLDLGCPIQLTSSSITGLFGEEVKAFSQQLLKAGKVSAIASDSHNLKGRKPDLQEGYQAVKALVGESLAKRLTQELPAQLINNNPYQEKPVVMF